MCGIYGSTILYKEEIVKEKLKIADFRGPDFSDYIYLDDKLVLGHNRLSIFDLDKRSSQPFLYEHLAIVFNGEIYNFKSLKKELEIKGYKFTTTSDTEVICAMFIEFGEQCVEHFIGMFSFVIYDKQKQSLFGARDRLGQKPFFYYLDGQHFEFASNLKQIKFNNNLSLNNNTCSNYFYFGYFVDPETPYNNVFKLEPGTCFNFDLKTNVFSTTKYWSLETNDSKIIDYDVAKERLNKTLIDAVDIRLQADVPVGLFLSGGVDSSLITALAKEVKDDISTFSIKFLEKKFDESDESKKIASYLGTNHHTFVCDLDKGKELINNFYKYYDEPFADVSSLPSMLLSSEVSKHVTVALTGDGADELFMGYERYDWIRKVNNIYKIPYAIRVSLSRVIAQLPNYKIKMLAQGINYKSIEELYLSLMTTFKTSYLKEDLIYNKKEFLSYFKNNDLITACTLFDMKVYLNSDINTKVDRASMAFSLETRSPFMDHRVTDLALRIPKEIKFKNNKTKYILKDILSDYIPPELFDRPKKGFGVPLESWLKRDLKGLVFDNFNYFKSLNLNFIDYNKFEYYLNEFYSNKANHSVEIWKMLMFTLWFKENEN